MWYLLCSFVWVIQCLVWYFGGMFVVLCVLGDVGCCGGMLVVCWCVGVLVV